MLPRSMPEQFEVERVDEVRCVRLALTGELDLLSAPAFDDALVAVEGEKWPLVILDLSQLDFIDSSGLRLIARAHARAQQDGRRVVVVQGNETIERVFELTHLDDAIEIVDDVEQARSRAGRDGPPA
jgi:anti-anti-sigma factor